MGLMKDFDIRIRNGGDDAIAAASELTPRWISASERLPNYLGEDVLVFVFDNLEPEVKYPAVGSFELGEGWHVIGFLGTTVTHWMPLPEPPEVK